VEKTLVKKTRRPRGSGGPKVAVTHISSTDELVQRHIYCVCLADIASMRRYSEKRGSKYFPAALAHCDHIEDGVCGHDFTQAQLDEVNRRLGGKPVVEEKPKRKRGEKKEIIPSYFCLKCNKRHEEAQIARGDVEGYLTHMKYKRGRGRPKRAEG
jgi:hypothetical protein